MTFHPDQGRPSPLVVGKSQMKIDLVFHLVSLLKVKTF